MAKGQRWIVMVCLGFSLSGVGCVSKAVKDGDALGLHTTWGPLYQTWRHMAAGGSGFKELGSTFSHLDRGQGIDELVETYRHLAADYTAEGPVQTFFNHVIGPYTFADLGDTFHHLR